MDDLDIRLANQGTIAARLGVDFDQPDTIGFDTTFALTEGRLREIGPFVALPPDLARGEIEASGSLAGRVRFIGIGPRQPGKPLDQIRNPVIASPRPVMHDPVKEDNCPCVSFLSFWMTAVNA